MKFIKVVLALMFILTISSAMARKPAVEDFVGVESSEYSPTSAGTEVLFNFNNSMKQESGSTGSTMFTILFIASFVSLPFFMWIGLTRSTKMHKKITSTVRVTEHQPNHGVDNVEYLSDYKGESKKAS